MFGLPVFLIKPLLYLLAAAAVAFVLHHLWTNFKASIGASYTQAQIKKDQPLIDKANANAKAADAEASNARSDTTQCQATAKMAGEQTVKANQRAIDAELETKKAIAARAGDKALAAQRVAGLTKQATAPPVVDQSCEDMRTKLRASQKLYFDNRDAPAVK